MHDFKHLINLADSLNIKYEKAAKTSCLVSFRTGGTATVVVYPSSVEQLVKILECIFKNGYRYFIIGNGTNTYFTDNNYDGIVICTKLINKITINDNLVYSECGALINDCALVACNKSLSGLEFSYGIPGTVGGCLCMNASAFDKSMSNVVLNSVVFDMKSNDVITLSYDKHLFSDKKSAFTNGDYILLKSIFKLTYDDKSLISSRMIANHKKREASQPLDMPNAGSVFKRPRNGYASRLIDEAGLKGLTIGGAMVSNKHAGFIVNTGNATSNDINDLVHIIQKIIYEKYGIKLEKEIIFVE